MLQYACSIYCVAHEIVSVSMQDAFRNGNELQLIARSTGYPLAIRNKSLFGNGGFVKAESELFFPPWLYTH